MKTVWILGAGFSRPLGGPLLADLISHPMDSVLKSRFASRTFTEARDSWDMAYGLYFAAENMSRFHAPWSNPEEFLEHLDWLSDAQTSERKRGALAQYRSIQAKHDPKAMLVAARSAIAAACYQFVTFEDLVSSERGLPYLRWARNLSHDDTILSFNYDQIPYFCSQCTRL